MHYIPIFCTLSPSWPSHLEVVTIFLQTFLLVYEDHRIGEWAFFRTINPDEFTVETSSFQSLTCQWILNFHLPELRTVEADVPVILVGGVSGWGILALAVG